MLEDLSGLYDGAYQRFYKNHFASIMRIVMSDGIIAPEEQDFLDRLAFKLQISEKEYKDILKNYQSYPFETPITYERRLESLYDLTRAVYADDKLGERQPGLLKRCAIGIGFTVANASYIVDKALLLVDMGVDLEAFKDEIKHMNR